MAGRRSTGECVRTRRSGSKRFGPRGRPHAATVAFAVKFLPFVEDVVLAGHVVHVEARLRDDAVGIIEFGGLGEMRDIAGMDDERWLRRQSLDLVDRLLERADGVRI